MSNIITNTILTDYPVAGIDNDSQGFRSNFANIQAALAQAKTELIKFEEKALLKTHLDNSDTSVVINDLHLGSIINGNYNKFYGTSKSSNKILNITTGSNLSVSLWDGTYQSFSITSDITPHEHGITFTHWPTGNQCATIRVQLTSATSTSFTLSNQDILSENNHTVILDASFPSLTIDNLSYYIIEAWRPNGDTGTPIFLKYIGRFDKP